MVKPTLAATLMLVGCLSAPQAESAVTPPNDTTARAGMSFDIEGKRYVGTAVIPRQSRTVINFLLPKGTIKFMVTSCSREDYTGNPDGGKPFAYEYIPLMYLENLDKCWMKATAITDKGETHMSIIEFRSGEELPGTVGCNGRPLATVGVGLCQTRAGLRQRIDFDVPVVAAGQDGCAALEVPTLRSSADKSFEYTISPGFCSYKFMDQKKRVFRLTTYGYETIEEILTPVKQPTW